MKVLTIGGATVDSIAIVDDARIERMTMGNADTSFLLLEEGRKTEAEEISNHCGGGAVNAAVSMARLGADASTLVKLGQDQRADTVLNRLTQEGVSTRWVKRVPEAATGASVLISSHEKNAVIFTFRGANSLLCEPDLTDAMFEVDLVYISSLSNQSADCFPELVRRAKAQGAMVAANPGIRQLTSRAEELTNILSEIDILSVNRTEADALVPSLVRSSGEGGPNLQLETDEQPAPLVVRGLASGGFEMTLAGFVSAMTSIGVRYVVVTDGGRGAYIGSPASIVYCPALPATIAGTAGAGDAFASTLSLYLAQERDPEDALLAASINASSVVGFPDTQSGLLSSDELQSRTEKAKQSIALRSWALPG